jgi:hypothetical protein
MASAATLYVNDATGDDTNNCTQAAVGNTGEGPCKTINGAIAKETGSDVIHLAGGPYAESVILDNGEQLVGDTANQGVVVGGDATACPNPTISITTSPARVSNLTVRSANGCVDLSLGTGSGASTVDSNDFDDSSKASDSTPDVEVLEGSASIYGNALSDGSTSSEQLAMAIHGPASPTVGDPSSTPSPSSSNANTFAGFGTAIAVGIAGDTLAAGPSIQGNHITGLNEYTGSIPGVGIDVGHDANPTIKSNRLDSPGSGTTIGVRISEDSVTSAGTGAALSRNVVIGETTGVSVTDTTGPVTMSQDGVRSAGGSALVATDTPSGAGGNVSGTNVDLIDASNVAAVTLNSAHAGCCDLTLDSSIVGGGTAGTDGGIATTGDVVCAITFTRGPGAPGPNCNAFSTAAAPLFVGTTGNEFKLGSAYTDNPGLIDKGNPVTAFTFSSKDLYGSSRVRDGDCDGADRIDMGVSEFQPGSCPAPPAPKVTTRATPSIAGNPRGPDNEGGNSLYVYLKIVSEKRLGNYKLCVNGPGKRQCKSFSASKSHGAWRDSVNWSKNFNFKGHGRYVVDWYRSGSQRLGTQDSFKWGACAPKNMTMRGVWRPSRLKIRNRCMQGYYIARRSFQAFDGDVHVNVNPNSDSPNIRNYEIIPRDHRHIPRPASGRRMRLAGVFLCDSFHGHNEFHPVFRQDYLKPGGKDIQHSWFGGPYRGGTPTVHYTPKRIFHCR